MAAELNFVLLHVRDVVAARDFYRELLDLKVADENPGFVQFHATGSVTFALGMHDHPQPTETVELWWQADDVDALHSALLGRGVPIAAAPVDAPFGRTLVVRDPEGNNVNFYQPRQG